MSTKITPSLESITIRGKYFIPEIDFGVMESLLMKETSVGCLIDWGTPKRMGESLWLVCVGFEYKQELSRIEKRIEESTLLKLSSELLKLINKHMKASRPGIPFTFLIIAIERLNNGTIVEVECRPLMWYLISKGLQLDFIENQVQEALIECRIFVKQVMSIFNGKEVEPVSVYPIIQRTEIKSRLLNLGLKEVVNPLDKAERHIVQNNFIESLKSSRTAFEKMIDWEMRKRGLDLTSNQRNNLDRLRSKGYLDNETTELLQSYYKCLSNIAVHERGEVEPGFYEANMGYGITLIMLDYLANKLP
jgi:hypothetical protein